MSIIINVQKRKKTKLLVGITMGDPYGIGPEILVKSLRSSAMRGIAQYVIIGSERVLEWTVRVLKIPLRYQVISHISEVENSKQPVSLLSSDTIELDLTKKRGPATESGELSVQWVLKGINLAMSGYIDALVTAPICKEAIHMAGYGYPGHTEMLQIFSGARRVVMLMVGGKLRVAFVTTHIALKEVSRSITTKDILETIIISNDSLKKYFDLKRPGIAVCGLNPHAGEGGVFGDEEKRIIIPAIERAKKKGIRCDGPVSADTIFYKTLKGACDMIVAIYHDQGAIPLKLHAFETGVNTTLGIPFVRTSPDHGTAYDIAGKGIADPRSMMEAIKMAVKMANSAKV